MKKEHPKTVNAKKKADIFILGNKLKVLKVNNEKFIIKIHERERFMILIGNFIYLDEKRLNPNTMKLRFRENIGSNIIVYNIKNIDKKIPVNTIQYADIRIVPTDLILGKKEYTRNNILIANMSIEIATSKEGIIVQ